MSLFVFIMYDIIDNYKEGKHAAAIHGASDFYLILINSDAPDPKALTAGHVINAAVTSIDKTVN